MFVTLASRLATWFAVSVGCLAGGTLALLDAPSFVEGAVPGRHGPDRAPLSGGAAVGAMHQAQRATTAASGTPELLAPGEDAADTSLAAPAPAVLRDLTPSPHDAIIPDAIELGKAERLCIRDLPDECVRVADAYRAGTIVKPDRKRASQYQNLAFKAYIRWCEQNQPEACYALARMYLRGDSVPANPLYAKNLMQRVVEVCRYRGAPVCQRLAAEAPVPARRRP